MINELKVAIHQEITVITPEMTHRVMLNYYIVTLDAIIEYAVPLNGIYHAFCLLAFKVWEIFLLHLASLFIHLQLKEHHP